MRESQELRDLYIRLCEAQARGDSGFVEQLFSRQAGVLGIGTDPNEWWAGSDRMLHAWKAQLEALGGKIPLAAGDPQAFEEGTVGWVADQPRFRLPNGDISFRLTCVFHREEGQWRLVQTHASLGVPNEAVVGSELPT
jgi:hypothetical protein